VLLEDEVELELPQAAATTSSSTASKTTLIASLRLLRFPDCLDLIDCTSPWRHA